MTTAGQIGELLMETEFVDQQAKRPSWLNQSIASARLSTCFAPRRRFASSCDDVFLHEATVTVAEGPAFVFVAVDHSAEPFAIKMYCHWALHVDLNDVSTIGRFLRQVDAYVNGEYRPVQEPWGATMELGLRISPPAIK